MRLKIAPVLDAPGTSVPFEFHCDLRAFDVQFRTPFRSPVHVAGELVNETGILMLRGLISGTMEGDCDRCLCPVSLPVSVELAETVSESLQNPDDFENADVIVPANGEIDLLEIVKAKLLISLDTAFLCSDDCKGLCPRCGKDLNDGPCSCEPEMDPRFAKLKDWKKSD